jgi:hypothetical protein
MKKFIQFLEYYDVYIDKPMGWKKKKKKVDKTISIEVSSNEDRVQENIASQVNIPSQVRV